jgi:hypothetical protein
MNDLEYLSLEVAAKAGAPVRRGNPIDGAS